MFRHLALVLPALIWTAVFFIMPLCVMLLYSFWQRVGGNLITSLSLVNYERFFGREFFLQALVNSLEVALLTTAISILLAYPLAYILAYRVPPRWQRIMLVLAILPFWTSYIVRSYSWLLVLSENGVINQTLQTLGFAIDPISLANSRAATVIGFTHFFTMLLTLTIFASLSQIPPAYRRAAMDLGASRLKTFFYITLPLSLPGVVVGAFLTFVLCIGDYITPQILGGNKELLLPQAIMLQIQRRADFPMAAAMSMVLMVVISLAFLACARWLKLEPARA